MRPPAENHHQAVTFCECILLGELCVGGLIQYTAILLTNVDIFRKMCFTATVHFSGQNWDSFPNMPKPSWQTNSVVHGH